MEPNHSDDLFREKLGKYSRKPDPHVWERIRSSLDQKKSRKLVPYWWALGGAAAVLLLSLFLFLPDTEPAPGADQVTETEASGNRVDGETSRSSDPAGAEEDSGVTGTDNGADSGNRPGGGSTSGQPGQSPAVQGVADAAAREVPDPQGGDKPATGQPSEREPVETATGIASTEQDRDPARIATEQTEKPTPEVPERPMDRPNVARDAETGIAAADSRTKENEEPDTREQPADAGKSIFEAIEEAEETVIAESTGGKRWSVGTNLAPVYFNSFGDGSPISQDFVSNSKSGTMNLSYGLSVAYNVSDKLSLRSGVNRVDFGYNTNQVAFTSTLSGPTSASLIRTISYSENARTVVVESSASPDNSLSMDTNSADVEAQSPAREGRMLQQFGYLEVPLEMEYRLIDRKVGLNLVGGMSSLFLVDNSVSLASDGTITEIGEATNMNPVSFSTNLGLGVYYNLNTFLQLQVQPVFKYHLNTFTNTAGNFQPYSIGVYSGIRYRF